MAPVTPARDSSAGAATAEHDEDPLGLTNGDLAVPPETSVQPTGGESTQHNDAGGAAQPAIDNQTAMMPPIGAKPGDQTQPAEPQTNVQQTGGESTQPNDVVGAAQPANDDQTVPPIGATLTVAQSFGVKEPKATTVRPPAPTPPLKQTSLFPEIGASSAAQGKAAATRTKKPAAGEKRQATAAVEAGRSRRRVLAD